MAWAIGLLVMGFSYGSVFGDMDSPFEGNEAVRQFPRTLVHIIY